MKLKSIQCSLILHILIILAICIFSINHNKSLKSTTYTLELVSDIIETKTANDTGVFDIQDDGIKVNLDKTPKIQKINKPQKLQKTITKKPTIQKIQKPVTKSTENKRVNDILNDALSEYDGTDDSGDSYEEQVINIIRPLIIIPDDIAKSNVAIFRVVINEDMSIQSITNIKASGNQEYDNNIHEAISKIRYFPEMPSGSYEKYKSLELVFRPE